MAIDPSQILDQSQDPSQQQPQQPPAPANNAQNAGPVKAGLRGVLARMMGNFSYGAGQAMLKAAGDETDAEKSTRLAMTAHLNAQTQLAQQQAKLFPYQLPNGGTVYLPSAAIGQITKQQVANQGKTDTAQIGADARTGAAEHKTITVPGVGGFAWDEAQQKYAPMQGAQLPQHQLAPGEAQQMGFSPDTTQVPESIYSQAKRLQPLVRSGIQWKETSPGVWQPLATTSTRSYGAPPKGAPQAGSPPAPNQPVPNQPQGPRGPVYGNGPVYGFDPKTNETVLTTPADAQANGYTNTRKVTQPQIDKDRQVSNRLTDVATKITRYEDAMQAPLSTRDRANMSVLLGDDKLAVGAFHTELPIDWLNKLTKSAAFNDLSPEGQKRMISYANAKEAMQGYQRVLSGSGHSSDTGMQLNIDALANPLLDPSPAKESFNQFKENIPIAAQGLPRLPGISNASDVLNAHDTVRVQILGQNPGTIPRNKLSEFQKKYPGARIIQ